MVSAVDKVKHPVKLVSQKSSALIVCLSIYVKIMHGNEFVKTTLNTSVVSTYICNYRESGAVIINFSCSTNGIIHKIQDRTKTSRIFPGFNSYCQAPLKSRHLPTFLTDVPWHKKQETILMFCFGLEKKNCGWNVRQWRHQIYLGIVPTLLLLI